MQEKAESKELGKKSEMLSFWKGWHRFLTLRLVLSDEDKLLGFIVLENPNIS